MRVEDELRNAVGTLTGQGPFHISEIVYDSKNFGNHSVVLTSSGHISIRFTRDRGQSCCELGVTEKWYQLNDVLEVLGVAPVTDSGEAMEFITTTTGVLQSSLDRIDRAFQPNQLADTVKGLREIRSNRIRTLFGIVDPGAVHD